MGDSNNILERLIAFTGRRHGVITSNIANADTPGYKTRDLQFDAAFDHAVMELKQTSPGHVAGRSVHPAETAADSQSESWGDGNNVEIDMEVAKMNENSMMFQAGISMLSTRIKMFKNALRRQ